MEVGWVSLALTWRECVVCLLMELQVTAFRMTRSLVMAFHMKAFAMAEEA